MLFIKYYDSILPCSQNKLELNVLISTRYLDRCLQQINAKFRVLFAVFLLVILSDCGCRLVLS